MIAHGIGAIAESAENPEPIEEMISDSDIDGVRMNKRKLK